MRDDFSRRLQSQTEQLIRQHATQLEVELQKVTLQVTQQVREDERQKSQMLVAHETNMLQQKHDRDILTLRYAFVILVKMNSHVFDNDQ